MCGIIGYIGNRSAAPILMSGLKRLEYRGYDSAGIGLVSGGAVRVHKAAGKLAQLEAVLPKRPGGKLGIGHTRWATHGAPTDANAHPHVSADGSIAVVHNGIVENAPALRSRLQAEGIEFASDTDTEIIVHLVARSDGQPLEQRVCEALAHVRGTYGIAVVDSSRPDHIVIARKGSPVIIGIGDREMFVASDIAALVRHTRQVVHLDDGEVAVVDARGFRTMTLDAQPISKSPATVEWEDDAYERDGHAHYMYKEILDQREAIERTLGGRLDRQFHTAHLGGLNLEAGELLDVKRVKLLGCGSAYYAGITGAHLIESLARIPASAEPAAEFRYRNPRHRARHALRRGQSVGRDHRHADGGTGGTPLRGQGARHRQRGRQQHRPRGRRRDLHARGSGGGGGVDQGLHVQPGRAGAARAAARPHARSLARAGPAARRGDGAPAGGHRGRARDRGARQGDRASLRPLHERVLHRARPRLPHRARRRAEAQGDLLYPRRGLSGVGAQARASRAHRARHPDRRRAPARCVARQVDLVDRGGAGAARTGDRSHPPGRRAHRGAGGRGHRGAPAPRTCSTPW